MTEAPRWFTDALKEAPRRSQVEVDGASINVLEWGDPQAPPVATASGRTP